MKPDSAAAAACHAQMTADLLALGGTVEACSRGLTLLALAGIVWGALPVTAQWTLFVAALAGAMQQYAALRVAFDQRIFAGWAQAWRTLPAESAAAEIAATLAAFDATRAAGGDATPSRGLDDRIAGARRWFRRQAGSAAIQFALLLIAAWLCLLPLPRP